MTSTERERTDSNLRYLSASKVASPAGVLSELDLRTPEDSKLGTVEGVLIDPAARRVCYYAVGRSRLFGRRRYLVPADRLPQLEQDRGTLRVQLSPQELERCPQLDRNRVPEFSDDDLLTAVFAAEVA
jgi:PRC-barrel domain